MATHVPKRRLASFAAAASAVILLASCTSAAKETGASDGGTAVIALIQEPGLLSPMFSEQSGSNLSRAFVVEPLFTTHADGTRSAYLAEEVPTVENGLVSADGLTVQYRLREGITWSDGEPLTADDLAFTVEVAQNPDGAALPDAEYASIVGTEVIDERTLAVTFAAPQPNFLNLFRQPLPQHAFDSSAPGPDDEQARIPLGTGPFVFTDWKSGDEIVLERNDAYWRDDAQPRLDGVTVKITPEGSTAVSGLTQGEFDLVFGLTAGDLGDVQQAIDSGAPVVLEQQPEVTGFVEWLWLNNSAQGALGTPHPVLGDPAVREAIDLAIDRQSVIDDVLDGFGTLSDSLVYSGFGGELVEPAAHDPERAAEVLDAAGWTPGADGVREKDGVRASLRFQTIAGDQTRALYQQILQQNLAEVGIETVIENVPSNTLFDDKSEGGLFATGDFDLAMLRAGRTPDPYEWVEFLTTPNIPVAPDAVGFSYTWWSNAEFDELVVRLGSEIDPAEREAIVHEINTLFRDERVAVPIYASPTAWAWSSKLQGVTTDTWMGPWDVSSTVDWSFGDGE